ncbi:ATP-binding cassette domain-containing protein [Halococcus sp. PRR34]|uniref:energy-coupling factor ABC transporter ATP-binding protein n=1 Tax=Halococcus sp. PRR34 TaxID=3020830 RepID=UPI00235E39DC|nr:ATP-binding cassette domain-containing protein [Halococcus sp. PRR34]
MAPLIRTRNLHLTYPDGTKALDGIDIELFEGEIIGLIGQNGSGKSTLSKCLNATLEPSKGTVEIDGTATTDEQNSGDIVEKVGYVFQNPDHQLFNRTVWDEIAYGPRNLDMEEEKVEERVREAAEVAGVHEQRFEEHPNLLTKGLRQRVAIASILSMKPDTIIVDEPTTGQDARQSLEIMNFLQQLQSEEDRTIIIVTHIIPIVQQYCDRVICLRNGKKLLEDEPKVVFNQPEELAKSAVQPSQIARLSHSLSGEFPDVETPYLTPDEAIEDFGSKYGR